MQLKIRRVAVSFRPTGQRVEARVILARPLAHEIRRRQEIWNQEIGIGRAREIISLNRQQFVGVQMQVEAGAAAALFPPIIRVCTPNVVSIVINAESLRVYPVEMVLLDAAAVSQREASVNVRTGRLPIPARLVYLPPTW